jgi:hypothetical protein
MRTARLKSAKKMAERLAKKAAAAPGTTAKSKVAVKS